MHFVHRQARRRLGIGHAGNRHVIGLVDGAMVGVRRHAARLQRHDKGRPRNVVAPSANAQCLCALFAHNEGIARAEGATRPEQLQIFEPVPSRLSQLRIGEALDDCQRVLLPQLGDLLHGVQDNRLLRFLRNGDALPFLLLI